MSQSGVGNPPVNQPLPIVSESARSKESLNNGQPQQLQPGACLFIGNEQLLFYRSGFLVFRRPPTRAGAKALAALDAPAIARCCASA
jgi:hypothetical protein